MDFDRLLDKCVTLESTIFAVIQNNARKQSELSSLQSDILKTSQDDLEELADYQSELNNQLETARTRKDELNAEIKVYNEINERLKEIVAIAQRTSEEKKDIHSGMKEEYEEYEQIKVDHFNVINEFRILKEEDTQNLREILDQSRNLVIDLYRNDQFIRVLERQNKYAEQQFDFILNELPWEPLSISYFKELRNVDDKSIRDLADVLQLQTVEINELNESLDSKKERKLEILEQFARQLDLFFEKTRWRTTD